MLNISRNSIAAQFAQRRYPSLDYAEGKRSGRVLIKTLTFLSLLGLLIMFLPWTQVIRARGTVTTLKPDQRPQTIQSVIAGRIERWYIQEGDFVRKGDTILFLTEIRDDFFDPELLSRTRDQIDAKDMGVRSYVGKVRALDQQIEALRQTASLKLEQAQNSLRQAELMVISDSMDYQAAKVNYKIATEQFARMQSLFDEGLKSLTDLENRNLIMQRSQAAVIAAENKWLASLNDLINAQVELQSIEAQYRDGIAKAESEKYTALSNRYDAEAALTKLENQWSNYSMRTGWYYITAPQDGYVIRTIPSGLGETIGEGAQIASIMPAKYDLAVEMYIKPLDLPLVERGQKVRLQFDGWPAIVFSGWPNTSVGTYGGVIYAIDNFISTNGLYRILVQPDPEDHLWPTDLRAGAGTDNMLLLKDVPIWYEIWRKINGFPPDYYKAQTASN